MTLSARHEFRRSWCTLLGSALGASVGVIGLYAYTAGAFVPELVAKAGFDREQLSLATLVLSATVALMSPLAGLAIDRWGATVVIAASVLGEALGFALAAAVPGRFGWYLGALVALGLLGAGTTPPGYARVVAARFDKGRGTALGLLIGGLGVMAIASPVVLTQVIAAAGWRAGYWSLCTLVLILGGAGVLLVRVDAKSALPAPSTAVRGGDWAALRAPLYWMLLVCVAAPSLFGAGYLLHLTSILHQRGFDAAQAAQVQALVGVSIAVGRLVSGLAMDRIFAPYVAASIFGVSAAGTALLLSGDGLVLCVAALAIGLTLGAELDILAFLMSRYFGLLSFGRLYGLAYGTMMLVGGASPVLIARLSSDGDYTVAIIVSSAGIALSAVLVSKLPQCRPARSPVALALTS